MNQKNKANILKTLIDFSVYFIKGDERRICKQDVTSISIGELDHETSCFANHRSNGKQINFIDT